MTDPYGHYSLLYLLIVSPIIEYIGIKMTAGIFRWFTNTVRVGRQWKQPQKDGVVASQSVLASPQKAALSGANIFPIYEIFECVLFLFCDDVNN
jgi:hypothetical protein